MRISSKDGARVLRLRRRLGLDQRDFWARFGVTQSGGSRYESGRRIPRPVKLLLELAYGNKPLLALKRLRTWS